LLLFKSGWNIILYLFKLLLNLIKTIIFF